MKKPIRTMLSVQATPDIAAIRTATLMNQEHTVIPCIALVEGVLWPANAPAPELALAEEFGRFPQGWNGRPVTYDHPKINGLPVSASSPDVLQDNAFGQLFNTELKGGKLHTEIWINEGRIASLGPEAQETVERLKNPDENSAVEVSTGLFTMSEPITGEWEGKEYNAVWRNIVPDHLAILPMGIKGACSVADGCGAPRLNESASSTSSDASEWQPVMRAAQLRTEADCSCTDNAITVDTDNAEDEQMGIMKKFWELGQRLFGQEVTTVTTTGFEPTQVEPEITSNSTEQENAMKEKLVNDLIANEGTQYDEDDREWLNTLEEGQLGKMVPKVAEAAPEVKAEVKAEVKPEVKDETAAPAVNAETKAITTNEYIASAPADIQEILNAGIKMHQARKEALVSGLVANQRCRFTADQLNAKSIDELESIAAMAPDITFEAAGPTVTTNEEVEENFTPAPSIFAIK